MSNWPRYPSLYEINTWVCVEELRAKYGKRLDLGSLPAAEWDAIAAMGFDAVWFMGVWERSPAGIAIANQNQQNLADFRHALSDFRIEDNVGSPYCVRQYVVDAHLGGPAGLAEARRELAKRGMKLIVDFVPNHVASDHPWVYEHPEFFVRGSADDLKSDPGSYLRTAGNIFACGRDPHFPAWQDVLQLNAFAPGLRRAAVETLSNLAGQCDGVRCDMAMLLLNAVFERTWGSRAGQRPATDYWREVIPSLKLSHPGFIFIAEAYWDLEWELQQQGFDFCYDKRLYDRLQHENAESLRLHLSGELAYQSKLLRFLENHDEPRAAAAFSRGKEQAAALLAASLPGARLFHEGQLEGRKVRLPVFLGRRPAEPVDEALQPFYAELLKAINKPMFRGGDWRLCTCAGWPDNQTFQNLVAWTWHDARERCLVAVNLSDRPAQGRVFVGWPHLGNATWVLCDSFSGKQYERDAQEMLRAGLYVELGPWGYHFFNCSHEAAVDRAVSSAPKERSVTGKATL
jgi:Alpha amylase, catalytic domain